MAFWPWHGDHIPPEREALRRLRHIADQLDRLERKVDGMSQQQDDIDAAVATLGVDQAALAAAAQRIQDEITRLQGQGVDTTALNAALASANDAVGTVVNIVPAAEPGPATDGGPVTDGGAGTTDGTAPGQ